MQTLLVCISTFDLLAIVARHQSSRSSGLWRSTLLLGLSHVEKNVLFTLWQQGHLTHDIHVASPSSPSSLVMTGLGMPLSSIVLKKCYISLQNEWMNEHVNYRCIAMTKEWSWMRLCVRLMTWCDLERCATSDWATLRGVSYRKSRITTISWDLMHVPLCRWVHWWVFKVHRLQWNCWRSFLLRHCQEDLDEVWISLYIMVWKNIWVTVLYIYFLIKWIYVFYWTSEWMLTGDISCALCKIDNYSFRVSVQW